MQRQITDLEKKLPQRLLGGDELGLGVHRARYDTNEAQNDGFAYAGSLEGPDTAVSEVSQTRNLSDEGFSGIDDAE